MASWRLIALSCSLLSSARRASISNASMRRARPWAMFHVRANFHPSSRATFVIAALRLPIQSRGAIFQMACCASTADMCKPSLVFGNILLIDLSMFGDMKRADTWVPLGTVTSRIAAKLIAARQGMESAAAPGLGGESAAARLPGGGNDARGFENTLTARQGDQAGMDFTDAARLPQGEAGQGKAAPRHGLLPLLPSKSSTTTSPEADRRVRSSQ